ncbi:hypothetical protein ACOWMF_07735 [Helicobacter pylori]
MLAIQPQLKPQSEALASKQAVLHRLFADKQTPTSEAWTKAHRSLKA